MKTIKGITIHQEKYGAEEFDFKIQRTGNNAGKILNEYSKIKSYIKIKVNLDDENREKILNLIENYNWNKLKKTITISYLNIGDVCKVLKEELPKVNIKQYEIDNEITDEFFEQ